MPKDALREAEGEGQSQPGSREGMSCITQAPVMAVIVGEGVSLFYSHLL